MSLTVVKTNTLKEISTRPEFGAYGNLIAPGEGAMAEMTLERFAGISCWNAQSIADGYNRLLEICETGKNIYYPLWSEKEAEENPAIQERYLIHFAVEKEAPLVIVCAGGGYLGCASMIEAFPTCVHLNRMGYHAFALNYRCGENAKAPNPLDDMASAVSYVLGHAKELGVNPEGYAICGFSAGGHLAACFGTERVGWKHYQLPSPKALFLGYPVITLGEKSHESTREMFLGKENLQNAETVRQYSAEEQVTAAYPPTFVWQCERDNAVPIENSQMLARRLEENKVPFIYETFDSDAHGWGAGDDTLAEGWVERAATFWQKL